MLENCCDCNLSPKDKNVIKCQNPMCPKAIDVDETETDPDRFAELFGDIHLSTSKGDTPTPPQNDFWAESDIAPL